MGQQKYKNKTQKIVVISAAIISVFLFRMCPAMGWANKRNKKIKMRRRSVEYLASKSLAPSLKFENEVGHPIG